jgi:hypothetical protein
MVMMLILMITLGGTLGFRYFSVLSAEYAEDQILAARAAQVIVDAWRGQRGDADFDPTQQGFDAHFQIQSKSVTAMAESKMKSHIPIDLDILLPEAASHLGMYRIDIEGRTFQAVLGYEDDPGVPNTRMLHVLLVWQDQKTSQQEFRLSTLTRTNV